MGMRFRGRREGWRKQPHTHTHTHTHTSAVSLEGGNLVGMRFRGREGGREGGGEGGRGGGREGGSSYIARKEVKARLTLNSSG